MQIQLDVTPACDDADLISACRAYWKRTTDGKWEQTAKAVSVAHHLTPKEMLDAVLAFAPAYVVGLACQDCSAQFVLHKRSDLDTFIHRHPAQCVTCQEKSVAKQHAQKMHEAEQKRLAATRHWEEVTSRTQHFAYDTLPFAECVRCFAMLQCSNVNADRQIEFVHIPPLTPTAASTQELLLHLHDIGILEFGRSTPISAFEAEESSDDVLAFYPAKVRWRFAPPMSGVSIHELPQQAIDNPTSDEQRWATVEDLWWFAGRADARRHLEKQLVERGLRTNDGPALTSAIDHALRHYSIPQVRTLMWQVARSAAEYSTRKGILRSQAINSIPGSIVRKVDRFWAECWELKPYVLLWEERECALVTALFDRVLRGGRAMFSSLTGCSIAEQREQRRHVAP